MSLMTTLLVNSMSVCDLGEEKRMVLRTVRKNIRKDSRKILARLFYSLW